MGAANFFLRNLRPRSCVASCKASQANTPIQIPRRAFSASLSIHQPRLVSNSRALRHRYVLQHPRLFSITPQSLSSSSNSEAPRPLTDRPDLPESEQVQRDEPAYELTFTCRPCQTRSKHKITKQGYHHGTVLITCPNCKNRHVISDHLKIFNDKSTTVEQLLAERGESIKKGVLGENGDMEFWEDGSSTKRDLESTDKSTSGSLPPAGT